MTTLNLPALKAIIYPDKESGEYLAHCLELDLMTSGQTQQEAAQNLLDVVATQIQFAIDNDNMQNLLHPAPAKAYKIYADMLRGTFTSVTETIQLQLSDTQAQPHLDLVAV